MSNNQNSKGDYVILNELGSSRPNSINGNLHSTTSLNPPNPNRTKSMNTTTTSSTNNNYYNEPNYRSSPNGNPIDLEEEDAIVADLEGRQYPYHGMEDIKNRWKHELYLLLEDPTSSRMALIVNLVCAGLIVFAVLLTTIETIPSVRELQWDIWFILELLIVLMFTIELVLRLLAHSNNIQQLVEFLLSPLTILDLFSLIPYYVMLLISKDTSVEFRFTILRVFRLFRLFRAYKHTNLLQLSIEVMLIAIKKSLDALGALLFFMLMTIVLFSTFLYFAERGSWDEAQKAFINTHGQISEFDSIPAAFWFVIVTITTTGYGDIVPATFLGKVIAFPLMMLGILLIALPSVIVGRNFTVVWDVLKRRKFNVEDVNLVPGQTLTQMVEDIEIDLTGEYHVHGESEVLAMNKVLDNELESLNRKLNELIDLQKQNNLILNQLLDESNLNKLKLNDLINKIK